MSINRLPILSPNPQNAQIVRLFCDRGIALMPCIKTIIHDSPYYVFVALCIVVIVVSLIKIAASNENIECFREYFAVGYRTPDPSFFKSSCTGQDKK
jgi:hypothetical protein